MADTNTMSTNQGTTAGLTDKMSEAASQAKEKAAEFGRKAADTIDQGRVSTASGLESAASSLRSGAQSGGQAITDFANTAADKLQNTASYVREHGMNEMMGDMQQMVKRNPGPSLIAAAAFGFLLGAALRRD